VSAGLTGGSHEEAGNIISEARRSLGHWIPPSAKWVNWEGRCDEDGLEGLGLLARGAGMAHGKLEARGERREASLFANIV
jgi:hypothetical protein